MLVGYFDWFVIFVLIFLNVKFWNSDKYISSFWAFLLFPIFFFVLPIFSIIIEFELQNPPENEDGFTMVLLFFRFPLYWILLLSQYIILKIRD